MNTLNLIKTVLFNAETIAEALTRLDDLGIAYRESDTVDMYFIQHDGLDVQFWKSRSAKMPICIFIDNRCMDIDDRTQFLAHQPAPALSTVPAETTPYRADGHPFCQPDAVCQLRSCASGCPTQKSFTPGEISQAFVKSYPKAVTGTAVAALARKIRLELLLRG